MAAHGHSAPQTARRRWHWSTFFNGVLALFAVLSFIVLWCQLRDARHAFVADQRPFIWEATETKETPNVEATIYKSPRGEKQIVVTLHYSNFGKTPAVQTRHYRGLILGPSAGKIVPTDWDNAKSILPPGKVDLFTKVSGVVADSDIQDYLKAQAGDGITFYATWQYTDTAGNKYETQFCTTRLNLGSWAYCTEHNDIKDCAIDKCEP